MKEYGQEAERGDAFSFAAYQDSYNSPQRVGRPLEQLQPARRADPTTRSRGSATLPQRWALFRDTKRRLEHGVPVGVLIQYVTMRVRAMDAHMGEVRHA